MCGKILMFVACLIAYAHVADSAAVSSFITKCTAEDSKCIKDSAQAAVPTFVKGMPEFGVEALEPLFYKRMDASSQNLKLILNDITVKGLDKTIIKKITRDPSKNKLFLQALLTVTLDGQYEMNGQLLVLPIQGKGEVHAILRKVLISVDVDLIDKVGKDGKKHWDIKSFKHNYELKDKSSIELENLFNGNELLGRAAKELLSSSSNEVIGEVGPPIIKALISKVVKVVDHFVKNVPVEDLAIE